MPYIVAAASALPPHSVAQSRIRDAAQQIFASRVPELGPAMRVFDHARIERRQFMRPLEWYSEPRGFEEKNRIYQQEGFALASEAAIGCLERAGADPKEVDHVIFVSSTGLATPTLDSRLITALGMRPQTSRLPVWGLGCAAGAAGLSRAFDYCRAHPLSRVLLIALECCSLTFMEEDLSVKNLIGAAIFSDGAAAVLVSGDGLAAEGLQILATRSHLFPGSERIMGWDFLEGGMQLVLSPRLPALIRAQLPSLVDRFLQERDLERRDLTFFITHPGGAKVIDAYRESLCLEADSLALTEALLREHGNVSSVSVLMVLETWLASLSLPRQGHGLLSAFGPGFSAEMVLLQR